MEEEIKQLKSVLRCLVVSSSSEMDVRTLLRDYHNMIGAPVPLQKFGYKDPLTFLKERCSDCFLFTGAVSNPILTLIVPEPLKHIDKFVQKQKPSASSKVKGKRRSVLQSVVEPPKTKNLIVESFICKQKLEQCKNTSQPEVKPPNIVPPVTPCANKLVNVCGGVDRTYNEEKENKIESKENNKNNSACEGSDTALQKFLKKRTPLYNDFKSEKLNKDIEFSKDENDSGRQTLSSNNSSMKSDKFEHLKAEIRNIIVDHPEGVLCTELLRLYRERYNKELEFSRWGYTSIVSVVCALGEDVALTRLDDSADWLARDARAFSRAPAAAPRALHPRLRTAHRQSLRRTAAPAALYQDTDADDALPGVLYDPDVYPEDCMQFTDSLLPAPLADVRAGALLEVMVGEVYSPSHFWLMRLGDEYHIAMDEMMDDMTEYYERGEGKTREIARGAVRPGQYCACKYEQDWHRALIVRELDSDYVKVRLVDYGTVERVRWRWLRALPRRWARLPQQAARARLAGVAPRARHWPRAASTHFLRRVHQAHLVAHVTALDAQENILEVFLIDTSDEEDLCLATDLIRSGHAEPRVDSCLATSECYLYPRFEAIETGATPNFGEIGRYLRDGIELLYVEEYRRHVPVDLPPSPPAPHLSPPPSGNHSPLSPSTPTEIPSWPSSSSPPSSSSFTTTPITRIPLLQAEAQSQTTPTPPTTTSSATSTQIPDSVRLSVMECEMYRELCATSPMAAHWFMMGALSRALRSSTLSLAEAPPFPPPCPPPFPPPCPPPFPAMFVAGLPPPGPLPYVPYGPPLLPPPFPPPLAPPPPPRGPHLPQVPLRPPPGFETP